jgi:hypothetical protein
MYQKPKILSKAFADDVSSATLISADLSAQQWCIGVLTYISGNILGRAMVQRLSPVSIDNYHPYIIVIIVLYKQEIL